MSLDYEPPHGIEYLALEISRRQDRLSELVNNSVSKFLREHSSFAPGAMIPIKFTSEMPKDELWLMQDGKRVASLRIS